jgi:hypothetical protein
MLVGKPQVMGLHDKTRGSLEHKIEMSLDKIGYKKVN